ncbi:MAG: alpha-1,2-fucosyltransferase [Vicingaceae bacterium]
MTKKVVISKLPKTGLGNKLFSWASGVVFARVNKREHIVTGLTRIHPMTFFRNDKSKRFYFGYFENEATFYLKRLKKPVYLKQEDSNARVDWENPAIFNEVPSWSDMFVVLKDYRSLIVNKFWTTLTEKIKSRIEQREFPECSIHIRMGDFRQLSEGENFAEVGGVRTPIEYFISVVNRIREEVGETLPFTIFSDGNDEQLETILSLPNVKRAEDDLDIVHLGLMSKSKLIVMSAGSTFSYWSGFLSTAILIKHYQHVHADIRDEDLNSNIFEGEIHPGKAMSPLLIKNLQEVFHK